MSEPSGRSALHAVDPSAVARCYGRWARLYDLVATRTPGVHDARRRAADALDLSRGDAVVEVGCGTGANLPHLRERVGPDGRVVGVDLTPGMLARARRRVARRGWENVHVLRGDAARPPTPAEGADAVLATFLVGMLDDPPAAVSTWADLVGDGGRVALLDAAPRDRRGPLDAAFGAFVALSAPPTGRLRYDESPGRRLAERVEASRAALRTRGETTVERRSGRGFLRLHAVRVER